MTIFQKIKNIFNDLPKNQETELPFIFEIHLTVDNLDNTKILEFETICQNMGGKAVLIELSKGKHQRQPMFSLVKKANHLNDILTIMDNLKQEFHQKGFTVIRKKVEIPAHYHSLFYQIHPTNNKYGYFEWHGKIKFYNNYTLQKIQEVAQNLNAHVSNNALKNQENYRFVTLRFKGDYVEFMDKVNHLITALNKIEDYIFFTDDNQESYKKVKLFVEKSQAEYCVYDNKLELDEGWSHLSEQNSKNKILEKYQAYYPDFKEYDIKNLYACEAFLRRAAIINNQDFMLKGSFVTRNFFIDIKNRIPYDLDFLYLKPINSKQEAELIFNDWMQKITTLYCQDGIYFTQFKDNAFWRLLDYAMHDDFPTVNTDLTAWIGDISFDISIDISFNLPFDDKPIPIQYQTPIDSFIYPSSPALSYQIAWKLHQSIVNIRIKDIYDLTHLVKKIDGQNDVLHILQLLKAECDKDGIDRQRILNFFSYQEEKVFLKNLPELKSFEYWQENIYFYLLPSCQLLPNSFDKFWQDFVDNMHKSGFTLKTVQAFLYSPENL